MICIVHMCEVHLQSAFRFVITIKTADETRCVVICQCYHASWHIVRLLLTVVLAKQ